MRVKQVNVYTFDELDAAAKAKAREWYRQVQDFGFSQENVYEDAAQVADLFGLDIRTRRFKCADGSVRWNPNIMYTGFWSQGDGACFEGEYRYKADAVEAVKEYTPEDEEIQRIVQGLHDVQSRYAGLVTATTKHRGHYHHSGCMKVDVEVGGEFEPDLTSEDEEDVVQLLRDFADWIYAALEREWEYQNSDEQVDESLRINEYEFTETGAIA